MIVIGIEVVTLIIIIEERVTLVIVEMTVAIIDTEVEAEVKVLGVIITTRNKFIKKI